jgi:hypothetical protein
MSATPEVSDENMPKSNTRMAMGTKKEDRNIASAFIDRVNMPKTDDGQSSLEPSLVLSLALPPARRSILGRGRAVTNKLMRRPNLSFEDSFLVKDSSLVKDLSLVKDSFAAMREGFIGRFVGFVISYRTSCSCLRHFKFA